jgi:hypothetical protein
MRRKLHRPKWRLYIGKPPIVEAINPRCYQEVIGSTHILYLHRRNPLTKEQTWSKSQCNKWKFSYRYGEGPTTLK